MVDQGWSGETRMIDVERPSDSITETRTNGARVGAQSKLPLSRQWVSGPMSLRAGRPLYRLPPQQSAPRHRWTSCVRRQPRSSARSASMMALAHGHRSCSESRWPRLGRARVLEAARTASLHRAIARVQALERRRQQCAGIPRPSLQSRGFRAAEVEGASGLEPKGAPCERLRAERHHEGSCRAEEATEEEEAEEAQRWRVVGDARAIEAEQEASHRRGSGGGA